MLLKPIFVVALIGHCLARADPSRSTAQNDARKPMLVYATNGEGKTLEAEKKSGFRRSIPPGAGLGFAGGFGNGGFNTGIGTGFVPNGGMNFGTGLGLGTGLPNNNFMGSSFGPVGLGNNFVGTGYTGATFGSAGLGNNILGTGFAGTSFGVDAMSNPFGYSNSMVYSPYANNMGGFGVNTGVFNQPGLGTSYWPNRQGLMTNGFNGVGSFNDPSGFNSLGINGNSFGGVNSFRNGVTGLNGLNGIGTGVGFNNNFGSLSNGINGFSSANSLNNRFGTGFNNGLNNFSSFNTGVSSSGFGNPSQFGINSFGESNSFKRSPLDPTSPYYIQLYNAENNEEGQAQSSNWNSRNSGLPATNRDTSTGTVTSHSAGGQVRNNSGSV
ncbi:ATP-dependent RNA helicase glh-2-like [Daphnia pulex]|uniref:ATP-dependent RNA helicase glh-2-like n=1 Tax=Daphnia pulex TaxID=6669 RepID=UPI001EE078B7|nr:ATP-dependent RNA helicase glh-2-like [Daphnia pulex]